MNFYTSKSNIELEIERNVKDAKVFLGHNFNSPLSKVKTFIRALANGIYLFIDLPLASLIKAIHPHTSEEAELHEWLKRFGLVWKSATRSIHKIRVGSTEKIYYTTEIPVGTIFSTADEKIQFQSTKTAYLLPTTEIDSRGFYTVEVEVECLLEGTVGNVAQDGITEILDYLDEIDVVYNPDSEPVSLGSDRETIASVRQRIYNIEAGTQVVFTPDWYITEAMSFAFVEKVVFKSSKAIGLPGYLKLMVKGSGGNLSSSQISQLEEHFESEEKNPGGVARVLVENIGTLEVNKVYRVYFASAENIPTQTALDTLVDTYFQNLSDGEAFIENVLKVQFLNLPDSVLCEVEPSGDVLVPQGEIAVKGDAFQVIGLVYYG
ncbi:MAG: baseplate J/gp47 family protein [Leptospiraceae bacterium]|nr:baseplate J/gp47 family protein [Leptospiraceae bacterium]